MADKLAEAASRHRAVRGPLWQRCALAATVAGDTIHFWGSWAMPRCRHRRVVDNWPDP